MNAPDLPLAASMAAAPAAATTPAIEFAGITRRFAQKGKGEMVAVQDVSLAIAPGEMVAIIGPSGCGKSTLLNMGAGLYAPSAGEVRVAGAKVTGPRREVAFMLQKDLLLPWRRIRENVELGIEIRGMSAAERRERANKLLDRCHLTGFGDHYPSQLSGGMRQRAALARTLAVDPQVLLLDEPFSALDAQTKMVLQRDLAELIDAEGKTALLITHDLVEAAALADRVLVMSARPGRIIEEIRTDLPHRSDPLARRRHPRMGEITARLMELLHVGESEIV
jgi:NitT/TauT family transport system ATP-binding protein